MEAMLRELALSAKAAARRLAYAGGEAKRRALLTMAGLLTQEAGALLEANAEDLRLARQAGLGAPSTTGSGSTQGPSRTSRPVSGSSPMPPRWWGRSASFAHWPTDCRSAGCGFRSV